MILFRSPSSCSLDFNSALCFFFFFFFFFFRKEVNRSGTLLLTTGSDTIEWSLPDLHLGFSFVYSLVRGLQAVVNAARAKQQKLQVWPFQGFEPVTS